MSSTRCKECHASIPVPAARDALTMRCNYCGLEQPVPDADARRRMLLDEQREARLRAEAEARAEETRRRREREDREEEHEREEKKRERRWRPLNWLLGLFPLLIAPTIIAVMVFDAPARLGFGASGADRLEQMQTQLATTGCKLVHPIESEYASGTVSKLIGVGEGECIRAFAAGGNGHPRLGISLFGPTGTQVAKQAETTDPQLQYCSPTAQTLRFQIETGVAAQGRLSHMVMSCPAPPAKPRPKLPAKGDGHSH